jgi:hypothetical protein
LRSRGASAGSPVASGTSFPFRLGGGVAHRLRSYSLTSESPARPKAYVEEGAEPCWIVLITHEALFGTDAMARRVALIRVEVISRCVPPLRACPALAGSHAIEPWNPPCRLSMRRDFLCDTLFVAPSAPEQHHEKPCRNLSREGG